jgi:hypothetical protein
MKRNKSATLTAIAKALCADYERRKNCVNDQTVSRRVRMEYVYLNNKLIEAAGEICGARFAEAFINEIGGGIGYAYSEVECMSETTYKNYKSSICDNIIRKLYLSD